MANDLNRSIKIYIDGTPAAQGIAPVEAAIQKLEDKLSKLNKSEANYETKSRELKKELEAKNRTLQNYKAKVEETKQVLDNLSGASYNKLIAVQSEVRKQLREATPGTEKYNAALEQNRRVTEAVTRAQKEMRVEVGSQGTTVNKAIEAFNKYAAIVTAGIAAITGAVLKLNQLREKRNEREEAKADVEALTGLDKDSINWLEEQAKQLSITMDESGIRIRQSATEILDAYKLVGSAKPELLNNKEALADVTKQTLILASASGMTLKDAVDAVTLSLNQYGDGAEHAARYANVMAAGSKYGSAAVESVTSAITKSGVAAASANIPIEQLVGTIETLAEKGIKDEIAGTGLKKFFLTLQTGADETNPKIVGLETALDNLANKQLSATKIKKMFGEEGYNVASVLINEADKVKYYTQAVTGTTVAVEQAATKSATAAAKLDQAKNKMNEMGIALLDKLNPAILSSVNGVVSWGQKFIKLIDFISNNMGKIITLTTAIVSYYTATKLATWYETKLNEAKVASLMTDKITTSMHKIKLAATLALSAAKYALTGNIKMATSAMRAFNTATKGNYIGLLVSLVATLAVGLYQFFTRTNDSTDALKRMNGEILSERRSLDSLFTALKNTTTGSQERRDIIQEINDKYGTYLPNLLTEKSNLDEINDAYSRINTNLQQQIALKFKNEAIKTLMEGEDGWFSKDGYATTQIEAIEEMRASLEKTLGNGKVANAAINDIKRITSEYYSAGMSWEKAFGQANDTIRAKYLGKKSLANGFSTDMANYMKSVYAMEKDIAKVEKKYANWMPEKPANELDEVVITANKPKDDSKGGNGGGNDDDAQKAKEKKRKEDLEKEKTLYTNQQAEIKKIFAEGKDKELQTEQQYNDRLLELKKAYLNKTISIAGEGSSEAADAKNQLGDIQLQERKKAVDKAIEEEKSLYEKQQRDLKEAFIAQNDENLKTQEDYEDAKEQLSVMHLQRSLEIAGLDTDARKQIEEQLFDFKMKCVEEELKERKKAADKEAKIAEDLAKKQLSSGKKQHATMMQYANGFGEAMGNIIAGQENALANFGDSMVDIVFDVLSTMIDAELVRLTGIGIATIAEAQAREIGSKGFLGIATGAALAAVIGGTIAAARAGLKAIIGGKQSSRSGSDSESSKSNPSAQVTVRQWASGNYDVIGQDDGKAYNDIPYIGPAPTGIVRRTSLISENGSELIINAEDLTRLQRHINYPVVIEAIQDARSGRVPQRASGNYDTIGNNMPGAPTASPTTDTKSSAPVNIDKLIEQLSELMKILKNLRAYVVLRDLHDAEELDRKSKQPFTKSSQ